jgi:hypothetical protein
MCVNLLLHSTNIYITSLQETRHLAVKVVRSCFNGQKNVGWGKEDRKPAWWPAHVPWTKRGLQSGVTLQQLRDVIAACYQHHNQTMDVSDHNFSYVFLHV